MSGLHERPCPHVACCWSSCSVGSGHPAAAYWVAVFERSDELANLLVGYGIPAHIVGLPSEVMASPFGQMLLPQLQQMESELNSRHQHSVRNPFEGHAFSPCHNLPAQS